MLSGIILFEGILCWVKGFNVKSRINNINELELVDKVYSEEDEELWK